jgi:hypothetical protein
MLWTSGQGPCHTYRPLTGAEYLELRDGRGSYGERVEMLRRIPFAIQPAWLPACTMPAHPALQAVLTTTTDTGAVGIPTATSAPYTWEGNRSARRDRRLLRLTYGWLGAPLTTKGMLVPWGECAFYAPYEANALAWYKKAQKSPLSTMLIIPVDRDRAILTRRRVHARDAGPIAASSGAKIGDGPALTHATFVAHMACCRCRTGSTPACSWCP